MKFYLEGAKKMTSSCYCGSTFCKLILAQIIKGRKNILKKQEKHLVKNRENPVVQESVKPQFYITVILFVFGYLQLLFYKTKITVSIKINAAVWQQQQLNPPNTTRQGQPMIS
jgi:hypothetical protein